MSIFASKFIQTIKTFSEDELKSFGQWLRSPWCNTNKNVPKLFEKLKKYYPAFDHPKLTKEKLFKQVLPNGKFSDRRMNNLLSEGYLATERFLIFQNLANNKNLQKDLLTQELQNRHLEDWFFRDAEKEIDRLEAKPIKDWEDHLDLLRLHRRVYHHPNQTPRMQSGKHIINQMDEQLDLVYLLEKAAIITEKIFRNRVYKDENHDIEQELSNWLAASQNIEHPAIKFYRMRFAYQEATMLAQYFELRDLFLEKHETLNEKEKKIHLISLLNDTMFFIRQGQLEISESLLLYKLGLKTQLILDKGIINHNTYRTIIAASNYNKSFDFSNKFIENNTENLEKKYQTDGLKWAKAHTAYWQNRLNVSLDILIIHKFKTPYFLLLSKVLTTQVYFDLFLKDNSYQSYLFDYFNSFEKWLTREKFGSDFYKKSFIKMVQKCRALARVYSDFDFNLSKIDKIFKNIENVQAIKWLLERKKIIINKKRSHSK